LMRLIRCGRRCNGIVGYDGIDVLGQGIRCNARWLLHPI
jgi:hypothetical protein